MVRRSLVIARMTGVTVLGQAGKEAARVTLTAVQGAVPAREGEEVMSNVRPQPGRRHMAALAIQGPAVCLMVRDQGTSQVRLMTQFTGRGCPAEVSGRCSGMTGFTGGNGVHTHERETCACMFRNQARGAP